MITKEIEFLRPTTTSEATQILGERGGEVTILSGGMSLMPMMNLGIVNPGIVMSLNHTSDLSEITDEGDTLRIGAMVRHRLVHDDPLIGEHAPMLASASKALGDVQVRNRGTIGGSICHADPSADYLPVLTVMGAEVELTNATGRRTLAVEDFLIDVMFTAREPSELLTAVIVPKQPTGSGSSFLRFARVEGSFAIVNAASLVEPEFSSSKVALGGVGPKPVVMNVTDSFATGITTEAMSAVAEQAYEAAHLATSDVHSDAEYRRHMAGVFARRAILNATETL